MSHTQKKHKVDRSFFIIAGCGASWATAAVSKQHYKEAHDHDAGERQAPETPEELEGPEDHHSMVYQVTKSVATGGLGQPGPRVEDTGTRGTKRLEFDHETPPNAKLRKTYKGGEGHGGPTLLVH